MMTKRLMCAVAMAATLAGASTAQAEEYVFSSWFGQNHPVNWQGLQHYFDLLREKTDGEADWRLVTGAQLASGPGTPEAVGDGLVDAGIAIAPYQPRLMAATNTIFSYSLLGPDELAAGGAMNEAVLLNCDQCKDEYHELNAVGFGAYSATPYLFMCRKPIKTVDDLKGLKIRSSGGGVSITEIAGGTPVSMSPGDATTALERGTLDCVLGSVTWLQSYGYMDVVEGVVDSPMGMGGPPLLMFVNRDRWNDMSPEVRKAHIELAPELIAGAEIDGNQVLEAKIVADAKARGISFTPDSEAFQDIMVEHDKRQYDRVIQQAKDAGVQNPEKLIADYKDIYAKWKKLLAEKGRDRDTYTQLLWDEVYSKLDPENL